MNEQMKQYTGTKTVKAMPMTMCEAYERKLLKNGVRPSECETDKAGYLVEYEGGYQSWSPADVFEKAYKPSETFADRIVLEFKDLEKRMCKCDNFLYSDEFSALDTLSRALLTVQRGLMGQYYFVLADRFIKASKMKVKLSNLTFGTAVLYLKAGMAVRRAGWKKGLPPVIAPFPEYNPINRLEYNADYDLVYIRTKDGSIGVADGAFYNMLSKYTWDKDSNGYISASFKDNGRVYPHRLQNYIIQNIPNGYIVDHINGNKLDNRMCNLRFATIKENNANRAAKNNSSSQYKGVSFDRSRGKWISSIQIDGKTKHIGRFDNECDAAIAYDNTALKEYGEFARLNFPKIFETSFVVKQVPANISADIIPNMQSLPQSAKDIIMARAEPHIAYTNQMLIVHPDGRADSWVPSSSDVFAEDWELVTE